MTVDIAVDTQSTTPIPPADILPPTPDEIDTEIAAYEVAKFVADSAAKALKEAKKKIVFMTDSFGYRPAHAEESIRLAGRKNTVTVTRGITTTVNEDAVAKMEKYIGKKFGPEIFERIFTRTIKHKLVKGASTFLKQLGMTRRTEEKVLSLFGRCYDVDTNEPSVKIEVINPEKPARTASRGSRKARTPKSGKAAA